MLRGLISDANNAVKISQNAINDSHVLQMIYKSIRSSESAAKEAENAKRDDLVHKELQQISILESYVQHINPVSAERLREFVQEIVSKMRTEGEKVHKGSVMKALLGPSGALTGQLVDKEQLNAIVDGML